MSMQRPPALSDTKMRWLRTIAAVLALLGGFSVVEELVTEGVGSVLDGALGFFALYGLYLFAFFAIRGRLPGHLRADGQRRKS